MEKFVDRIIETDRRAREIIEAAQQEKETLTKQAALRAEAELAKRAAVQDKGIAALNAALDVHVEEATAQADKNYIAAKHLLDKTFDANRDRWLAEIVAACKA